jgi:hypothetical protein
MAFSWFQTMPRSMLKFWYVNVDSAPIRVGREPISNCVVLSYLQLQVGNRNRPVEIVHGILGVNKRHAERRHGVDARLDVVLNFRPLFE